MRYLRLYGSFLRFSLSRMLEFRLDFYFRVFMDLVFYAFNIATTQIFFTQTSSLAGWNEGEVMLFLSAGLLTDAIYMTFYSTNLYQVSLLINKGDLDYYLLRPASPLFFLLLRDFSLNSLLNFFCAAAFLVWVWFAYEIPMHTLDVAVGFLFLWNGATLMAFFTLLCQIPIFWTHSGRGLMNFAFALNQFTLKPDNLFRGTLRYFLLSFAPMILISSFPTRMMLEGATWELVGATAGVSAVFYAMVYGIWRLGIRHYSSASS